MSTEIKERDSLFEDAAKIVVEQQHGSASFLQRKLLLGYMRANRIIDQLEAAGIVGPFLGTFPRTVLFQTVDELKLHLEKLSTRS